MKRWQIAVFLVVAGALAFSGLAAVLGTRLHVVWFRGRPWVLKYGPWQQLGPCQVAETADPTSDVLSNLIDTDSDGQPEWRAAGFIDGSAPSCERRWLGIWLAAPTAACQAAAEACTR